MPCPAGKIVNPKTGRCIKKDGRTAISLGLTKSAAKTVKPKSKPAAKSAAKTAKPKAAKPKTAKPKSLDAIIKTAAKKWVALAKKLIRLKKSLIKKYKLNENHGLNEDDLGDQLRKIAPQEIPKLKAVIAELDALLELVLKEGQAVSGKSEGTVDEMYNDEIETHGKEYVYPFKGLFSLNNPYR